MTEVRRLNVSFLSEGVRCSAWLYLPDHGRPAPVMVIGHGLGAVRAMQLGAYAERFRDAGYACLVFDYRHFGDSDGQPRQILDVRKQLQDWQSAIDFIQTRPEVNRNRVILWGTSFAGGHVIASGARNKQVAAVIAQCPFTDGLASSLAVSPISSIKVTTLALIDQVRSWLGCSPLLIATSGVPHSAGLMTAPDAMPGYLKLVPEGVFFPNKVAARIALQITTYFPGREAKNLSCPTLFCVCEPDTVAPSKATLRHALKAKQGQINLYREGHFDIYFGEAFERVVSDQLDFLRRNVPLSLPALSNASDIHTRPVETARTTG